MDSGRPDRRGRGFVYGLAGFGIGLVSLALLPFVMPTTDAIVLTTHLRRRVRPGRGGAAPVRVASQALGDLILGSFVGTVPGVWALAVFPPSLLNRVIGLVLIAAVLMEVRGERDPHGLAGRSRAVAADWSSPGSSAGRSARRARRSSSTRPLRAGVRDPSRGACRPSSSPTRA